MTTDTDIPKQALLVKLLKMTTSDNDGEALTALRKANALLASAGWDWERLIRGKIRIIEDPFKNLGTPSAPVRADNSGGGIHNTGPLPSRAPPRPAASAPVTPPKRTTWPLGIQSNTYAGWCYCCGTEVLAQAGFIFKPITHNARGSGDWKVACHSCNGTNLRTGASVPAYPASRVRPKRGRHSLTDLA